MSRIQIKGFFEKFSLQENDSVIVKVWYPVENLRNLGNSHIQFTESEWEILKQNKTSILEYVTRMTYARRTAEEKVEPLMFTCVDPDFRVRSLDDTIDYHIGVTTITSYHPDAMLWILEESDEIDKAFAKIKEYETNTESFIEERERARSFQRRCNRLEDMHDAFETNPLDPAVVQYIEEMRDQIRDMSMTYMDREIVFADILSSFQEINKSFQEMVDMNIVTPSYFAFMRSQARIWKFVEYAPFELLANYQMMDFIRIEDSDAVIYQYMETMRRFVALFLEWDYGDFTRYFDYRRDRGSLRRKLLNHFKRYIVYLDIPRWIDLYEECGRFAILADVLEFFGPLSLFGMVHERYVVDRPILLSDIDRIVAYANGIDAGNRWIWIYTLRIFYYIDVKRIGLGNKRDLVYASIGRILTLVLPDHDGRIEPNTIQRDIDDAIRS